MQRGSDRVSAHQDDAIKHQLTGLLRSGRPTRSEEWQDSEPLQDDTIDLILGGGDVRSELARRLRRTDFPADAAALAAKLIDRNAADRWVEFALRLPKDRTFHRIQEVVEALDLDVPGE